VTYLERLATRIEEVGTSLCVGVDPDPAQLPAGFGTDVNGVERLANLIVDAALDRAAAIKVNVAFFEAFGSAGIAALQRLRERIPPHVPLLLDAKRADIGSTAARQAVALFDALGADAVTASPYLGEDALRPLLDRVDRFVYVLCRTSNPGAAEIQDLPVAGEPLYLHVARRARVWAGEAANVGLVVGATASAKLGAVREAVPELPFLVPGVGAQGGETDVVREHGPATAGPAGAARGGALLVNVSRGIASAAVGLRSGSDEDIERALSVAVASWADILQC
jgi:orotidine-5'-phosphate decarboxylase